MRRLCQELGVGVASYYRWRQKVAAHSSMPTWERELCHVFFQHQRRYGTRRLQAALQAQGHRVGRHRIRHALRRRQLVALRPRAFVPRTTQSEHGPRVAANHLLARPAPTAADQVWVGDITMCPCTMARGPIWPRLRMPTPSAWWAGRCWAVWPKSWWLQLCGGRC
ncbi:IS3 family transposase [Hymenobacter sp. BT188]|uniref:IS3 family transposase n=1 Tax=Hymenobacter sp. BT188 TaxID=2763504 RepID=UPI0016510445|nr:IS3 family transposase [Hymenobacter sp. BT188]